MNVHMMRKSLFALGGNPAVPLIPFMTAFMIQIPLNALGQIRYKIFRE